MHWLSEYHADHLSSSRSRLPSKISSGPIIVVSVRPKIPPILKDNLSLPILLLLVCLYPLILINTVHELAHTSYRLPRQRFSQIILGGQADLESPYSYVIKIPINLIKHLPVLVRVCFQGLSLSLFHGQQRVQGSRNSTTSNKT